MIKVPVTMQHLSLGSGSVTQSSPLELVAAGGHLRMSKMLTTKYSHESGQSYIVTHFSDVQENKWKPFFCKLI